MKSKVYLAKIENCIFIGYEIESVSYENRNGIFIWSLALRARSAAHSWVDRAGPPIRTVKCSCVL
jgi:hypothetical protein